MITVYDIAFKTLGFNAKELSGISNARIYLYLQNVKDDTVEVYSHSFMSCPVDLLTAV